MPESTSELPTELSDHSQGCKVENSHRHFQISVMMLITVFVKHINDINDINDINV